jgi:four helix bundle protein
VKNFRDLDVWKFSHELTLTVYRATRTFPNEERFGLISQIRRAAASIPANIAEGCGRGGDAEFQRFLQIAMGSASELEYHILLARDLEYLDSELHSTIDVETQRVKKMLSSLMRKVNDDRKSRAANA